MNRRIAEGALDRAIERARIAARKIGAGRAAIGHEQRVTHEGGITNHMGHAGRCVSGGVHDEDRHRADLIGIAILEQPVELAAIAPELGALVEDLAEGVLHDDDVLANADLAAELLLDVGRA
jgi:hypothetical protein